jgi:putative tributyrin esterase
VTTLPEPWPTNPWPTRFRTVRASPPDALSAGLQFVTVQSPALAGRGDLAIFAPPGVALAGEDVPLVVLLHGVYGSFWNWAFNGGAHDVLAKLMAQGEVGPMVLAMPSDGLAGEGTAYLDHGTADFERWVIDDVPACVAEAIPCVTDRSALMLAGNSMGGFGALRLAARHADRVAAASAHSPITDLDDLALFTADDLSATLGVPHHERSLAALMAPPGGETCRIHIDCGVHDPLIDSNRRLHEALDQSGVRHTYEEYDGAHDWASWHRRIGVGFKFLDGVARAMAPTGQPC